MNTKPKQKWTKEEDALLRFAIEQCNDSKKVNWKEVAKQVKTRSDAQCCQRWTKSLRPGLVKGHWTSIEDKMLINLVQEEGFQCWTEIATRMKGRNSKQCRERWESHLCPAIKFGEWDDEEIENLIKLYKIHGPHWGVLSRAMNYQRSESSIRHQWQSVIKQTEEGNQAETEFNLRKDKLLKLKGWEYLNEKTKDKKNQSTQENLLNPLFLPVTYPYLFYLPPFMLLPGMASNFNQNQLQQLFLQQQQQQTSDFSRMLSFQNNKQQQQINSSCEQVTEEEEEEEDLVSTEDFNQLFRGIDTSNNRKSTSGFPRIKRLGSFPINEPLPENNSSSSSADDLPALVLFELSLSNTTKIHAPLFSLISSKYQPIAPPIARLPNNLFLLIAEMLFPNNVNADTKITPLHRGPSFYNDD